MEPLLRSNSALRRVMQQAYKAMVSDLVTPESGPVSIGRPETGRQP